MSAATPLKSTVMRPHLAQSSRVLPVALTSANSREDKTSRERRRNLLERKSKALLACSSVQSLSMETDLHPVMLDHKLGDKEQAREVPTVYLQTEDVKRTNQVEVDRVDSVRSG